MPWPRKATSSAAQLCGFDRTSAHSHSYFRDMPSLARLYEKAKSLSCLKRKPKPRTPIYILHPTLLVDCLLASRRQPGSQVHHAPQPDAVEGSDPELEMQRYIPGHTMAKSNTGQPWPRSHSNRYFTTIHDETVVAHYLLLKYSYFRCSCVSRNPVTAQLSITQKPPHSTRSLGACNDQLGGAKQSSINSFALMEKAPGRRGYRVLAKVACVLVARIFLTSFIY